MIPFGHGPESHSCTGWEVGLPSARPGILLKYPTGNKTGSHWGEKKKKNYPAPNVSSAKVEKPVTEIQHKLHKFLHIVTTEFKK